VPRVAIVGSAAALAAHAPAAGGDLAVAARAPGDGPGAADVVVAFDPSAEERERLAAEAVPAIVWLSHGAPTVVGEHLRTVTAAATAGSPDPWRTVPPPVADRWFAPAGAAAPAHAGRAEWLGPPTPRREVYDHHFGDDVAIAPDGGPESDATVAVGLADTADGGHALRVALARGRLVVTEPGEPGRGLEAGIDYLVANALDDVRSLVAEALRSPAAVERVRLLGRRKAELFRSSRVVGRLAADLLAELDVAPAR